nr:PREDICTED: LOW QUALITY PROTEIN: uncharacterized protein LOC105669787 [Linepithema humile]
MSFVLQLGVEPASAPAVENAKDVEGEEQPPPPPPPTLLFAREIWRSQEPVTVVTGAGNTTAGNTVVIASNDDATVARNSGKSQLAQCLEAMNNQQQTTTSAFSTVKSVVTYPVAKGVREQQRMIAGSQTNTTQVLTTRVISQKAPSSISSTGQTQPLPVSAFNITNVSANSTSLPTSSGGGSVFYPLQTATSTVQSSQPVKNQTAIGEHQGKQQQQQQLSATSNVQATLHHKYQPVSLQQHIVNAAVKTINTVAAAASNIQRIHVKTASPSVVAATGQSTAQTMNLQKVKTVTSVNTNQPVAGVVQRNNSLSRIQGVPKSQMLTSQIGQLAANNQAAASSANSQKVQQGSTAMLQKTTTTQPANAANTQKAGYQSVVCNNQKISSQLSSGGYYANHKTQQYAAGNQQTQQPLGLQKVQGSQKSLAAAKQQQQQQSTPQQVNNVSKCSGPVTGTQKSQTLGQHLATSQKLAQRSQSAATGLQKSQTLATVQAAASRTQIATSNVCKSNSVPNISKIPQHNSSTLTVSKQQQQISQPQQQQPVMQKSQQQQSASANNLQSQRSHSITSVHQKVITTIPNNQRTQDMMNSKAQQQQQQQQLVMRVGMPKGQAQASQSGAGLKGVSQKLVNSVKNMANSQNNAVQQPVVQRNSTSVQPVKIVQQQQQQQNVIGPQNAPQKQPGCIKTIPPQKPVQRNHAQKLGGGIKTSLNTNVTTLTKVQGPAATPVMQKTTSIKTLLPQQMTVASSNVMAAHKNSPIKIQQQAIQQKQLIMAPQYSQQMRQHVGQIKTLLPVTSTTSESRKDIAENKNDIEFRMSKEEEHSAPKSPVRRMPLPYECLQFVLQDHNYGAPPPRTPPPPPPSPPPHPKQQPINGAGSSTATSQHSYIFGPVMSNTNAEDDAASVISSEAGREAEPEGEETETAPEGEGDDEDSVTRCICDFEHDDGYMICCDRCLVWQHVDCMGIDRSNIPDEYLCERCRPRRVDRQRARALQMRKREELLNSDTSSDTSSTSSVDTDVGSVNNTTVQKKRSLPQQQSQVPRRSKSDASAQPAQVRRLNNNNNNNNNVAKRQRRDSHARQSSAVRKKENTTPKRGPGKRKAKRRMSLEDKEEDTQDAWGTNMAPLRQWIERYEEAVTNHYSPELRARISSIKVNGTHSDLRQCNMNVIATGKCRLNVHSNNLRFLVATMYLPPNTPVVELRGKYMLSTQHRPQHPQGGRQHAQRPGPFVFFYRLPRDGTEVCVDTRTYGNDARFVRRSCKPNAEVKHCIEKGTLHLYIVTTSAIEKNAEITIKHEQHDLLLSPNPNSPALPVVCACNNPRECQIANAAANQLNRRGSNGALAENADGRERRRRGRRNTICEETDPAPPVVSTSVAQVTTVSTSTTSSSSSSSSTVTVATPRRAVTTAVTTTTTRQVSKEEPVAATVTSAPPQTSPSLSHSATAPETKKDKKKMTREERKMEAIMKAFERMEKAEQRKQEVQARNAQRKESSGTHSDNEDSHSTTGQSKNSKHHSERPLRRKRRKGRARTTSTSQSQQTTRRTRMNSAESDVSSGDESNSVQSPPLLGQNRTPNRDIPYSSHLHTPGKNAMMDGASNTGSSSTQGIPTAAGLLLALANSNAPGPPSSPPLQQPTPVKSPTCDSGASSSSQSSTPSTPLSSACLLVAAAVGPLAPGFKFPKTKKVLMNEWLKESPDPPQANIPQVSPLPALPSAPTLHNSMNTLCARPSEFPPLQSTDPSAEFLSQSYAAKSLATLVQAANSVSGICDSPLQRKQQQATVISSNNNNNNNNNNGGGGPVAASTGSAKKRWLRQAISEECDSPNSRPESPPSLCETVAPPKKRRIARESLSSDNYTPPTTPTMMLPTETTPNSRSLCPTEDDCTEHAHSPIVERNDEKSESVKKEVNVDDRPMDSSEPVRGKLNDIFPQADFYVKSEEKPECSLKYISDIVKKEICPIKPECSLKYISDIVKKELSPVTEMENVLMKEEKVSPKWEKNDIESKCDYGSLDPKIFAKIRKVVESGIKLDDLRGKMEPFPLKEAQVFTRGTVEIVDQNEPDTEMEGFSSPIAVMESDAILKQRVAEMQLEFSGGVAEIVNIVSNDNEKSDDEKKAEEIVDKCQEIVERLDDNTSIDEFDVEAQMKKITGDDGNDYQEKIDVSSEKDKSIDGIEGLMESSKEDSDSEDKDMDDDKYCEFSFKLLDHEETSFQELDSKSETKSEPIAVTQDDAKEMDKDTSEEEVPKEVSKEEQSSAFTASTEEVIFESASCNADTKSVANLPKIFHSIPPLSERIRKKTDPAVTSKAPKMDFEVAIIESAISMDTVDDSKNGEEKSMLSTALRELLEAKLDDVPAAAAAEVTKNNIDNEVDAPSQVAQAKESSEPSSDAAEEPAPIQEAPKSEETSPVKEEDKPKEIKRLKDPRTVVPNSMPAPSAFKADAAAPVKRKLSISEYRKRKQQSSGGTGTEPESPNDSSTPDKSGARGRSDSASSGTSSLSSDEEGSKTALSLDLPSLTLAFANASTDNDEKKGGEEGAIGWSAAPTLVERQRENLTERLKREFGLLLSDDEEERARKHGLTAEAILKAHKSPPHNLVASTPPGYPGLPQLPPQPYIPPPGSASIHYPQFQSKPSTVQYPNFAIPPPQTTAAAQQPMYSSAPATAPPQAAAVTKPTQQQQFLVPQASQAPPGANPYPPPSGNQAYPPATSGQPQKPFLNNPASRS